MQIIFLPDSLLLRSLIFLMYLHINALITMITTINTIAAPITMTGIMKLPVKQKEFHLYSIVNDHASKIIRSQIFCLNKVLHKGQFIIYVYDNYAVCLHIYFDIWH